MKIHHVGYLTKNLNKSKFLFLKLRTWILTMRLENSIPGNDSVVNVH